MNLEPTFNKIIIIPAKNLLLFKYIMWSCINVNKLKDCVLELELELGLELGLGFSFTIYKDYT